MDKHQYTPYGTKFAKFSWSNSQLLFSDWEGQILVIFADLGKSLTELGNYSVLGRRLTRATNISEIERIPKFAHRSVAERRSFFVEIDRIRGRKNFTCV